MGLNIYLQDDQGEDIKMDSHLQITHNLNRILLELDKIKGGETCYYKLIWRPDEIYNCENGRVTVKDVLCHLPDLLQDLMYHQDKLEQYLPENGYGSFDWLYSFLCDYMKECLLHQDSFIYCCR